MADHSPIEWTEATWNPVRALDKETGKIGWACTKVSPGCTNCYAEKINVRLGTGHLYRVGNMAKVEFVLRGLDKPLHWKKPRRIFVNSMTDLFHENLPDRMIDEVFAVMARCPQHTFQVLTKRTERMSEYCNARRLMHLPNVWLGTSVENQETAEERIPHLMRTPAAVRWLSCEPLLGEIDLDGIWGYPGSADGEMLDNWPIQWVVIGGESGTGARPCNVLWVEDLMYQCQEAGVAMFVKQLGAVPIGVEKFRNKKGGDWREWPEMFRVREYPTLKVSA